MLRVTCPHCKSTLHAKPHLAGQTRNCPKCKQPVTIEPSTADASSEDWGATTQDDEEAKQMEAAEGLPRVPLDEPMGPTPQIVPDDAPEMVSTPMLESLDPTHRYVICSLDKLVATWEGDGWMISTPHGFAPARSHQELLPLKGQFVLVEIIFTDEHSLIMVQGIRAFELERQYAMQKLARGEDEVLQKIRGWGVLNARQKTAILGYLRDAFLHDCFEHSPDVHEFLTNEDFHSHVAGDVPS